MREKPHVWMFQTTVAFGSIARIHATFHALVAPFEPPFVGLYRSKATLTVLAIKEDVAGALRTTATGVSVRRCDAMAHVARLDRGFCLDLLRRFAQAGAAYITAA